jgi:hypothetical protein
MPLMTQSRDERLAKKRAQQMLHRDERNAKQRLWRTAHRSEQVEKSSLYYSEHRDELLAYRAEQRAEGGKTFLFNEWLDSLKSAPCVDCGNTFPACAMDWDHTRGEKLFNLGSMRSSQWVSEKAKKRILEEIAKCDLVCACCHRVRTSDRRRLKRSALAVKGGVN